MVASTLISIYNANFLTQGFTIKRKKHIFYKKDIEKCHIIANVKFEITSISAVIFLWLIYDWVCF